MHDRLDPGDIAPHLTNPRSVLKLPTGPLEAQIKRFLLEIENVLLQLILAILAQIFDLHCPNPSAGYVR